MTINRLTGASIANVAGDPAKTAQSTNVAVRAGRVTPSDLSLGECVCLALIDEGVNHGWAIGSELAPDTELGRVWSLSRPLTYRALELLTAKELVRRQSRPSVGQGRDRVLLSCSPAGRRLVRQWLDMPVEHLREVRTELLLKLVLRRRRGLELESLLGAQQESFREHFDVLTTAGPGSEVVDLWRRESARAVRRFLDVALGRVPAIEPTKEQPLMRLSARNQLRARVASVTHGEVMSTVKTVLPDGQVITAVITKESVIDLDIAPDDEVVVVVKSTEVMLAKP
jgi:molybdopterin-binding protein